MQEFLYEAIFSPNSMMLWGICIGMILFVLWIVFVEGF
jgi:hypothetical protein